MAVWLSGQGIDIDRVLVSPFLRAQQTLQAVRDVWQLPVKDECLPELTPGGSAEQVRDYLEVLSSQGVGAVLVISHLPLVGYLVAALCPQETAPMFATSAVADVQFDPSGPGVCQWQVSPAQLLAKSAQVK
ncbi:phosphohistidine phosphatase, SixA [Lonsdalea quercina]|uniref:Phosphohistidine phosphatase, SixA n=2 Tax=Lonsdalea quercina TaxID=71657 RepID=A0A1H3ZQC8_9GAMM|nr:phosphohistidine phosphatase, SixA [Lonsdalea quercina]